MNVENRSKKWIENEQRKTCFVPVAGCLIASNLGQLARVRNDPGRRHTNVRVNVENTPRKTTLHPSMKFANRYYSR